LGFPPNPNKNSSENLLFYNNKMPFQFYILKIIPLGFLSIFSSVFMLFTFQGMAFIGRHDTHINDIQHNDTQHNKN